MCLSMPLKGRWIVDHDDPIEKPVVEGIIHIPMPEIHKGGFGYKRKHHQHEGVDLYCPDRTEVYAIEDGEVVAVGQFTGAEVDSPWWNSTSYVMIKGDIGVINYGEIYPFVKVGDNVKAGDRIGVVKQVLKKDKGTPMSMLHLEWYEPQVTSPVKEWRVDEDQPEGLQDPTTMLVALKCVIFKGLPNV